MNIEIKINEKIEEDKITIEVKELTNDISNLISNLKMSINNKLKVFLEEELFLLDIEEIETIYASEKKIYVKTIDKEYLSKSPLYELENVLPQNDFIRISNSEIININKVKSINTKLAGTIVITFHSGYQTYSSRRYINKIKEALNI